MPVVSEPVAHGPERATSTASSLVAHRLGPSRGPAPDRRTVLWFSVSSSRRRLRCDIELQTVFNVAHVFARLFVLTLLATVTGLAADEWRITSASNVRLRRAPATDGPVAGELPLGASLVVLERTQAGDLWYQVKTDDDRNGWVLARLTAPLDPERRA